MPTLHTFPPKADGKAHFESRKVDGVHGGGKWRGEKERRMAQLDDLNKYVF